MVAGRVRDGQPGLANDRQKDPTRPNSVFDDGDEIHSRINASKVEEYCTLAQMLDEVVIQAPGMACAVVTALVS
jgi:hypothetical protein